MDEDGNKREEDTVGNSLQVLIPVLDVNNLGPFLGFAEDSYTLKC
jgi:hypothetical protein